MRSARLRVERQHALERLPDERACWRLRDDDAQSDQCWTISIRAPDDSMYAGQVFVLDVRFPLTYPVQPPIPTFREPPYHPNIDASGSICASALADEWTPSFTVDTAVQAILHLLREPNPDDPLRPEAADLLRRSPAAFQSRVQRARRLSSARATSQPSHTMAS